MSALGDYVHLTVEGYEKWGVAKFNSNKPKKTLNQSLIAQRRINEQRIQGIREINPNTLAELKSRISNESTQKQARDIAQGMQQFNAGLSTLTEEIKKLLIDRVPHTFDASGNQQYRLNQSKLSTNTSLINIEKAKAARKRFYDNIETINRHIGTPVQQRTLDALLKNASDFFNYLGIENEQLDFIKYKDLTNQNTASALQNIMRLISLSDINKAALNGTYGEVLVNMVNDQIREKSGKAFKKAVEESLKTGETRTRFSIDEKMIAPSVQQQYLADTGINLYQIRATQDKVDASIIIKNQSVDTSIKAYTPRGNVITAHLQDVDLISSLIMTQNDFANHWLNLHALKQKNARMDEELQKQIEYEALVKGNLLKTTALEADAFVVIDAVNGRTYVKSTRDILTKNRNNFKINPMIQDILLDNKKILNGKNPWEQRISNILQQLHQNKISVMYKVNLTE